MHDTSSSDLIEVTVVIPTRNRADILGQTVESVLLQQDVAVYVVVVDDASTDETAAVLARYPSVAVVRHEVPTEQRIARNDGARLAKGSWLAFCDDDDIWAPTKLRTQIDAAVGEGADWCTCSALFVDEDLTPIGAHRLRDPRDVEFGLTKHNLIPGGGSGVLLRRELFEEVGGFRPDAKYVEDWDLWIRLAQRGRVTCVDELLVAQRQWSRSFSHQDLPAQVRATEDMTSRYNPVATRPRHTAYFEVRQRLRGERRSAILRDVPRMLRNSPEDWQWVAIMLLLPDAGFRRLQLRLAGHADVRKALQWLAPYQGNSSDAVGIR